MNSHSRHSIPVGEHKIKNAYSKLKSSDKAVLKYLDEMARTSRAETCTVSIPKIASGCNISKRQVQISTRRLIEAELIERIGYDFSNHDLTKRGTIYKVLPLETETRPSVKEKKKSIKLLLLWSEE
jgi:DNA-binding Lrp family transcriptional regulator